MDPPRPNERPEILEINVADPVIEGSLVRLTGLFFDVVGDAPVLSVDGAGGGDDLPLEERGEPGELFFRVTAALVNALGEGYVDVDAVLRGDAGDSDPYPLTLNIARDLPVTLDSAPTGNVHYNDQAVVYGRGILSPTEGTITAHFEGTFTSDMGGGTRTIDARLAVLPAERTARDRGLVRLTTALGGVEPGTFDGSVTLDSELASGSRTTSTTESTRLVFLAPDLYGIDPATASLEQVISITGAGFLGGPTEPDEATVIRLEGMFTPLGGAAMTLNVDLVLAWVSGSEMRGVIQATPRRDDLVSTVFGARRGTFVGRATPVVIKGADEVNGDAVDFMFRLDQVQQIVWVHFIPGFYDSLARFGLSAAYGEIEPLVEARIESIYSGWNVDVRLQSPDDFSANGFAQVEIGGLDPNGVGLFGYDNTPGKDVYNKRLFDRIGGNNAETQFDGNRGYGGVFVESMLYFSSHPDLPGDLPPSRPDPDPLFDEIFDPVRNAPASVAEIRGEGDGDRVNAVRRALEGLASMIGETTAHELGHSLGMADPYGPPTVFHNPGDQEGCLMDSGGNRPIGERTAQPGFAATRLCGDHPAYLDEILGN